MNLNFQPETKLVRAGRQNQQTRRVRSPGICALTLLLLIKIQCAQGADEQQFRELEKLLGNRIWTSPEKRFIRATIYQIGSKGADSNSKAKKGSEKIQLHYATEKEVGTVAAPSWLARGSIARIKAQNGFYVFIASDVGGSVERGHASKKLGKNKDQKRAPVLDFCIKRQQWPDFVQVELFYYSGKIGFEKLSKQQQGVLFAYARKFFKEQPQ